MISQCRSCKNNKLKEITSLGEQYLAEFARDNQPKPKKYPLDLVMCTSCSLLQLGQSVPQSELYTENYGYKSGINDTIREDLHEIVNKARAKVGTKLQSMDYVLDIGANDGTLLSFYPSYLKKVACEPIKKLADEAAQHSNYVINDYWSFEAWSELFGNSKAKIITVISCFYDIENPNKFVEDLTKVLHDDGIIVIQQNYLGGMLAQNAFDNIVHEHIEYYSLKSLEHLLNRYSLEVFEVELNNINGGSFRTYIRFMDSVKQLRMREDQIKIDKWGTYFLFSLRIRSLKTKVRSFILEQVSKGKKIYLYGASTRGNSLIQYFELNNKLIQAAVERNPEKWGKKIASLDIPIISEEQARKDKPDYLFVMPWYFKEEFLEREKEYLESGGHFIFSMPDFEVI